MELACNDKLAKDINGVKKLLVRQHMLDGTVDAKGRKKKESKETIRAIMTMVTKKTTRQENRTCSRVLNILQKRRNTNLLGNEAD